MKTSTKVITLGSVLILLIVTGLVYFKFFFVFAEGVKAGELNQFALKGYVFKTYEGKIIQAGIKGGQASGANAGALIESYNLEFSVQDPELAQQLMNLGGQLIQVHYKQYKGVLPWRGNTRYIVDQLMSTSDYDHSKTVDPVGSVLNL